MHQHSLTAPPDKQAQKMRAYYAFHARIYDATRWSFLFGRKQLMKKIPLDKSGQWHIAEVGCGTGYNLEKLAAAFPNARLSGIDVSENMLQKAGERLHKFGNRVRLLHRSFAPGKTNFDSPPDLILFSYALTMMNPGWQKIMEQARAELRAGGCIAVVDFHDSPFLFFKKHMGGHHVKMDGHLLPVLQNDFCTAAAKTAPAYGGLWQYFYFIGQKD